MTKSRHQDTRDHDNHHEPPAYAELHVTTNFTFLEGASHPQEYVARAAELGLHAVAITDRNSLAGVVRAFAQARKTPIRILVGSEICLADGERLIIFPRDRAAYGRLSQLITRGRRRGEKGTCILYPDDVLDYCAGQVILVVPPDDCSDMSFAAFADRLCFWKDHLPGPFYVTLTHYYNALDAKRLATLSRIAQEKGIACVATNNVLMHNPKRRALCDVLTCMREKLCIDAAGFLVQKNAERHLKSPAAMAALFSRYPQAIAHTLDIADQITFSLDELRYNYPQEVANGRDPQAQLQHLVNVHINNRFPAGAPEKIKKQMAHELRVIAQLNYAPYFLTVYDIVRFARREDKPGGAILCQGRGSAANSVICYILGITSVSPDRMDMVFERFISSARNEPPDIDVDFEHQRREEVIQYIYRKYGRAHAGLTATVICYRARSAIRDIGKVLGLCEDTVSALASQVWGRSGRGIDVERVREVGLDPDDPRLGLCLRLMVQLIGFPRHLSQHVGGFVMTKSRLDELVPIENAAMQDRTVIEWDKDDIDALGILKVDVLGLGMLTCIRKSFALLRAHYHRHETLASIPQGDKAVYDMFCAADTIGIFQIESRAQMSFLPRMRPRNFYDLVIEIAIVRPGPIQGDMVHPYLRRRDGKEPVSYPSVALEKVLKRTLGVPLFQEQAMRIAIVGAGFSADEADGLRRAMATFKKNGTIHLFREKFITGMRQNGYDQAFAERCFSQIEGFGEYGFPESHAASFALLAYVSGWLKCHYPAAFACALLNAQPMGFYAPAQIVRDARAHGVAVRPVDVNFSNWDCTLEQSDKTGDFALRLGMRQIKGVHEDDARWIVAARGNGYGEPRDLWRRAGIEPALLERLARADAFRSMKAGRRNALWSIKTIKGPQPLPLFDHYDENETPFDETGTLLPKMTLGEHVVQDYVSTRLSLRAHPMGLLRARLRKTQENRTLLRMPDGTSVCVAGIVLARQRPGTAKGVVFITLEDDTGSANLIVWRDIFQQYRRIIMTARAMRVRGVLQRQGLVTHVIVKHIDDISFLLQTLDGCDDKSYNDKLHSESPLVSGKDYRAALQHPREHTKRLFPSRDFH